MKPRVETLSGDNVGLPIRTLVIMGPSGCGKTTIGQLLARKYSALFIDADTHHPAENIEKMAKGVPLGDEDRLPWLSALADLVHGRDGPDRQVLACSALKDSYRQVLRRDSPDLRFACLVVTAEELAKRLSTRAGHFFHPGLLENQLETLEVPPEGAFDGTLPAQELVPLLAEYANWHSARAP